MARIKHIAFTTQNPDKVAEFVVFDISHTGWDGTA